MLFTHLLTLLVFKSTFFYFYIRKLSHYTIYTLHRPNKNHLIHFVVCVNMSSICFVSRVASVSMLLPSPSSSSSSSTLMSLAFKHKSRLEDDVLGELLQFVMFRDKVWYSGMCVRSETGLCWVWFCPMIRLYLARRFWNHVLTCVKRVLLKNLKRKSKIESHTCLSLNRNCLARFRLSSGDKYLWAENLFSSIWVCCGVNLTWPPFLFDPESK